METIKLSSQSRDVFGKKTKKGRREGLVPAVVYGRGIKTKSLWVKELDFLRLVKKSGESTMIDLEIDKKEKSKVLIYELQKDPVSEKFRHIDFFQVRMDEEIEKEVELVYVNEAPAVKEMGGVLVKNIDGLTVKCLPADLPSKIEVDISILKTFEDRICVKDLKFSVKIEIELDPETVLALVTPPRSEAELEGLEAKVEEDVTKVKGVVKEAPAEEGTAAKEETKE